MKTVPIPVHSYEGPILAGQSKARIAHNRFQELIPEGREPIMMVMNFEDVEMATATFLQEITVNFRDSFRTIRPNCYFIVANLKQPVEEELNNYLHWTGDALNAGMMSKTNVVTNEGLLGKLDPALDAALGRISVKGVATVAELHASSEEKIGLTAWNNRLKALAAKSLVIETAHGRLRRYHAMFPDGHNLIKLSAQ